jgi:hypothetical protein
MISGPVGIWIKIHLNPKTKVSKENAMTTIDYVLTIQIIFGCVTHNPKLMTTQLYQVDARRLIVYVYVNINLKSSCIDSSIVACTIVIFVTSPL